MYGEVLPVLDVGLAAEHGPSRRVVLAAPQGATFSRMTWNTNGNHA